MEIKDSNRWFLTTSRVTYPDAFYTFLCISGLPWSPFSIFSLFSLLTPPSHHSPLLPGFSQQVFTVQDPSSMTGDEAGHLSGNPRLPPRRPPCVEGSIPHWMCVRAWAQHLLTFHPTVPSWSTDMVSPRSYWKTRKGEHRYRAVSFKKSNLKSSWSPGMIKPVVIKLTFAVLMGKSKFWKKYTSWIVFGNTAAGKGRRAWRSLTEEGERPEVAIAFCYFLPPLPLFGSSV